MTFFNESTEGRERERERMKLYPLDERNACICIADCYNVSEKPRALLGDSSVITSLLFAISIVLIDTSVDRARS